GGARRRRPPGVGGHVGADRGEVRPGDVVGGAVQLELRLVAGVVGPGQVDLAGADGRGRQVARRRRRCGGGFGDVGGGGVADGVGGHHPVGVGGRGRQAGGAVRRGGGARGGPRGERGALEGRLQ